jgi:pimeloyl-[acyl-carrier protein] methyl ester esterase
MAALALSELPQDWLLLRGLGREAGHWEPFPEARVVSPRCAHARLLNARLTSAPAQAFASALPPSCRIHCLDNPGVGSARERRAPLTLSSTASDVLLRWHALRRERGISGAWGVLGISLGGMLAVEIASRAGTGDVGEQLRCAVAINTSGGRRASPPWQRLLPGAAWGLLRCLVSRPAAREAIMAPLTVNDASRREGALARWRALAAARPLPRRAFFAQLAAAATWLAPQRVGVPVLLLASRADRLTSFRCSEALRRHLGAHACCLALHDTAGHDLTTDDPEWVALRVRDWLAQGATPDGAPANGAA